MAIRPIGDRIAVKPVAIEEKTKFFVQNIDFFVQIEYNNNETKKRR